MQRLGLIVLLICGLFRANMAFAEIPTEWHVSSDEIDPALFLESALTYSDPDYDFGLAYKGAKGATYSGGLDAGTMYEGMRISLFRVGLMRTDETYELLGTQGLVDASLERKAKKTGTYFCVDSYAPLIGVEKGYASLDFGSRVGGSNLKVSDELFDALGGSTGSELGAENGWTQFSHGFNIGSSLHVLGRFSVGYSFMWNQEPKTFKLWHSLIAGTLQYGGLYVVNNAPDWVMPVEVEQSVPYRLLSTALLVGTSVALFNYTYDNYNWPYEEPSPLRSHAHRLTMNIALF